MNIIFEQNKATIENKLIVEQILLKDSTPVVSDIEVYTNSDEWDSQHIAIRRSATPLTELQFKDYVINLVTNRKEFVLSLMR